MRGPKAKLQNIGLAVNIGSIDTGGGECVFEEISAYSFG
jgi:hypothetical protein